MSYRLIHDSLLDHPVLRGSGLRKDPYSSTEAFIWLINEAKLKACEVTVPEGVIRLERGQLTHSYRFIAKALGWTTAKVQRYLDKLKRHGMIDTRTDTGQLVITLCKFNTYQRPKKSTDTPADTVEKPKPIHYRYEPYQLVYVDYKQELILSGKGCGETHTETEAPPEVEAKPKAKPRPKRRAKVLTPLELRQKRDADTGHRDIEDLLEELDAKPLVAESPAPSDPPALEGECFAPGEPLPVPDPVSCTAVTASKPARKSRDDPEFDKFYAAYPLAKAPAKAHRAFKAARKIASFEVIMAGVERYCWEVRGKAKRWIAHPATWLGDERWKDEQVDYEEQDHERRRQNAVQSSPVARDAERIFGGWSGNPQDCANVGAGW